MTWAQIGEAFGITATVGVSLLLSGLLWARLQIQRLPDDEGDAP